MLDIISNTEESNFWRFIYYRVSCIFELFGKFTGRRKTEKPKITNDKFHETNWTKIFSKNYTGLIIYVQ